ncbi:MFS transporter [Caballeronia sp. LZ043]|uniref:MFS transporter n=1 Tax=Caballeronia sp. LZ043 TaxID=3038569 RepID=UPI002858B6D0|nr:MFS transporter [Caballeronia sp. LZ043]MDR5826212.1 MFS transporter [Caballeronia sp. LZ043]
MFAVALCGFCPFLAVYTTQPLLPLLAESFAASNAVASLTITATTLAVALAAPFIGIFADLWGRKILIVAATLGLAVPTLSAATASTLHGLIGWRFMQGLLIPGIFSVSLAYISEEWTGATRASATSAYVSGNVFGSVSGRVIAGICASHAGWQAAFEATSILLFCGGCLVWAFLPVSRNFHRQPNAVDGFRSMALNLKSRSFLAVAAVGFNTLFVFVATFTYITFRLAAAPFDLGSTALGLLFLLNLFGAVATPVAGRWMDRVGARTGLFAALSITAVGLLLTLTPNVVIICAGLALVSTGVFVANSAASSTLGRVRTEAGLLRRACTSAPITRAEALARCFRELPISKVGGVHALC